VSLSVAGTDRGTPGAFGQPWRETFGVEDMPSPSPLATETTSPDPT
jgi:hypothetical protein